jgi:hypothetical protein
MSRFNNSKVPWVVLGAAAITVAVLACVGMWSKRNYPWDQGLARALRNGPTLFALPAHALKVYPTTVQTAANLPANGMGGIGPGHWTSPRKWTVAILDDPDFIDPEFGNSPMKNQRMFALIDGLAQFRTLNATTMDFALVYVALARNTEFNTEAGRQDAQWNKCPGYPVCDDDRRYRVDQTYYFNGSDPNHQDVLAWINRDVLGLREIKYTQVPLFVFINPEGKVVALMDYLRPYDSLPWGLDDVTARSIANSLAHLMKVDPGGLVLPPALLSAERGTLTLQYAKIGASHSHRVMGDAMGKTLGHP